MFNYIPPPLPPCLQQESKVFHLTTHTLYSGKRGHTFESKISSQLLNLFLLWLLPPSHTQELKETLAEELDFEHEAHNLEECGRDLRELSFVYVPQVHWELTSKRVMTAEWIDGCKSSDRDSMERMGLSRADVSVCVGEGLCRICKYIMYSTTYIPDTHCMCVCACSFP